ncbi:MULTISPECIES: helix-turn-helix domain-containing protein [Streptomyces]|uniref:helix-turn-helix domain-containing protein n=1 Tax=Streptomyces TaxID=1883 RepID=UPI001CEF7E8F|nr:MULTISPECIES: helix-turn-helix domain-containing protein [Streptomyces]
MNSTSVLRLRAGDHARLEALTRMSTAPAALVRRARIILLAAGGVSNTEVAARLGVSRQTVIKWRTRYAEDGLEALGDLPRPGRPGVVDEVTVLVATLADGGRPPARLAAPRWSSRLLGAELGLAHSTVAKVWRKWGVRPHLPDAYRFPTVPRLAPGVHGVVGVLLAPPWNTVVVRTGEQTPRGLDDPTFPHGDDGVRTGYAGGPVRGRTPVGPAFPAHAPGASSSVHAAGAAPLPLAPGAAPPPHAPFLAFLDRTVRLHPHPRLSVVVDSRAAGGSPEVRAWLAANPRVSLHLNPAFCPWSTLADVLLGVSGRQRLPHDPYESAAPAPVPAHRARGPRPAAAVF